jgi:hypothetical protein
MTGRREGAVLQHGCRKSSPQSWRVKLINYDNHTHHTSNRYAFIPAPRVIGGVQEIQKATHPQSEHSMVRPTKDGTTMDALYARRHDLESQRSSKGVAANNRVISRGADVGLTQR